MINSGTVNVTTNTGLKVHAYSRSKHLIAYLHSLEFCVHYSQILRIETQLAQAVISRMSETGGIYIPPGLHYGRPLFFAADNIDFSEDTHDGKNTLHATVMVAFQQLHESTLTAATLPISTKASSRSLKGYNGVILHNSGIRGTPKPINSPRYPHYSYQRTKYEQLQDFHQWGPFLACSPVSSKIDDNAYTSSTNGC